LPGPGAIYVSQTLNFRAPVREGDRVVAKVRVVELFPIKRRARFECMCSVDGKLVLEGEAVLMAPAQLPAKPKTAQMLRTASGICVSDEINLSHAQRGRTMAD
jgi:acyl-CoA thioesterase FadM